MNTETTAPVLDENQIIAERRAKLAAIRQQGIAFPNDFDRRDYADKLATAHGDKTKEALETEAVEVQLAGRMMLKRVMGKASFATLQDMSGRIQVYISNDHASTESHDAFKHWDLGDFIGVTGILFKTNKGELTIQAKSIRLLSEKFHGLADQEQKYRQRYLDLITNDGTRETFKRRSKIIQAIRGFMVDRDFLEVETPMMHPIPGGAAAKPFATHHNALDMELFLRIAPELYLKRLVVGGFEKVFEINRNFRNEGLSTRHNPEFTMMEFYEAYRDYKYLMDTTEAIIRAAAVAATGSTTVTYQGHAIELGAPFDRLTIVEAIRKYHPIYTVEQLNDRDWLIAQFKAMKAKFKPQDGLGGMQLSFFEETTEALLIQPTFIIDYPAAVGAPIRYPARDHRALRAVYHRPRNGQWFLRVERRRRPGRTLHGSGQTKGSRRRGSDALRRRLHSRAGTRPATHRWLRYRHRPAGDAVDRFAQHPRRDSLSANAPRELNLLSCNTP